MRPLHWLLSLTVFIFIIQFGLNITVIKYVNHFTVQAYSFLDGRLDIQINNETDLVHANGKTYWHQGPFPSVALIPFLLLLGQSFDQPQMQILLLFILCFLLYKLTQLYKFSRDDAIFLIFAFIFGSPFYGVLYDPSSWHFSQVLATTLLVGVVYEYLTKKRALVFGVLIACLFATRPTTTFISGLIIYTILFQKNTMILPKLRQILFFVTPIVISIMLVFAFNYARFGSFFDTGYATNHVGSDVTPLREMGLFNYKHIPTNFYYYFLISFIPVPQYSAHLVYPYIMFHAWGLSFFIVAPIFILTYRSLLSKDNLIRSFWLVCGITLLCLLCFYASGGTQFGPRYTLDFLPLLFVILLYSLKDNKLSQTHKVIICISCLLNSYLLLTSMISL